MVVHVAHSQEASGNGKEFQKVVHVALPNSKGEKTIYTSERTYCYIDTFFAKLYIPLAIIPLRRAYSKSTDFIYETGCSLSDDPNGISREPVSLHHKAYH